MAVGPLGLCQSLLRVAQDKPCQGCSCGKLSSINVSESESRRAGHYLFQSGTLDIRIFSLMYQCPISLNAQDPPSEARSYALSEHHQLEPMISIVSIKCLSSSCPAGAQIGSASSLKDAAWATGTCTLGWSVQGMTNTSIFCLQ